MLKSNPASSAFYPPFIGTGIKSDHRPSSFRPLPPFTLSCGFDHLIVPTHFYYLLLDLQVSLETRVPENSIGAITLPSSLMSNLPTNDVELASRVQFNFFETPALFQVKLLLTGLDLALGWRSVI